MINSDLTMLNKLKNKFMGNKNNPRRAERFWLHHDHFIKFVDLKTTTGLEIGAYDLAMVEPNEGKCDFADYQTTDELRHHATIVGVHNPEFIVPVKYDLRNGYDGINKKYDWIVACHVIEHIPDLINWFSILSSKLNDNGLIFLIIPDKRYTFDIHRRVTSLCDLVRANIEKLEKPSYAQVFDHFFYTADKVDPIAIWAGCAPPAPQKNYEHSHIAAQRALVGFEDAHCSVFTPESFAEIINDLNKAGLTQLVLKEMRSTQLNQIDFSIVLKKL
jgi:Methyltransferase domain